MTFLIDSQIEILPLAVLPYSEAFAAKIELLLPEYKILCLQQESSDRVLLLDSKGIDENLKLGVNYLGTADAYYISLVSQVDLPKFACLLLAADCLQIVFVSDQAIACVHAGWRGLSLGLIDKVLDLFLMRAQDNLNLEVFIGPAAKACCYEVGPEVSQALSLGATKQKIDLQLIAQQKILAKLPQAKVKLDPRCTICSTELFSYRRDKTHFRNVFIFKPKFA